MSKQNNIERLGKLKLRDDEKQAIAEMVETPGFKIWKRKLMVARELRIAGAALNAVDEKQLYYAKGRSYENGGVAQELEDIAAKYHANQINED